MEALAKKLRSVRQNKQFSIEYVSECTKIRPHVINAIENCDFTVMPLVYMKSFIKTYADFLEVVYSDDDFEATGKKKKNSPDREQEQNQKDTIEKKVDESDFDFLKTSKNDESKKKKTILTSKITSDSTNYSEIFKQKKIKSGFNPGLVNYIIYGGIALILIVILYFTFFYSSSNSGADYGKSNSNKSDTVVADKGGLLDYFKQTDSLTLIARAFDTAWVKLDIDGREADELVMTKGMEKKWSAHNYFLLSQGSIGAVEFYRNGEKLPLFGKQGGVVKNIKITKDKISNASPWQGDTSRNYGTVNAQVPATKRYKKKQETKPNTTPVLRTIDPSPIQNANHKR